MLFAKLRSTTFRITLRTTIHIQQGLILIYWSMPIACTCMQ